MSTPFPSLLAVLLLLAVLGLPAALAQSPCTAGTATADLATNNVRARLYNDGGLFWHGAGNVYNVPKAPQGNPITPNAIFAANLWTGGRVNGELHQSAATYANWEFIPGPLNAQGQPPTDCTPYNRIATVRADDLHALARGEVTAAVRDWPHAWGAPVRDGDGVPGNYNLAGGDRPELLGTETHWWVMNAMGPHLRTGSKAFPLEVQVTAFAAASRFPALNDATLYRYRFVWRGTVPLTDFYAGLFADVDLGNASDDYIGADSARSMVYAYNADNFDEGSDGYGERPPAVGIAVLPGLEGGQPARVRTARWLLKSGALGDPQANSDGYYNLLRGAFPNGASTYRCGDTYNAQFASCGPTYFTFTGQPEAGTGWTMRTPVPMTTPLFPSDHRMMVSAGPVTLAPGERYDVIFAIPWARGTDHLDSVARLRISLPDDARVRVTVADALGRVVARPHEGVTAKGVTDVALDAARLAPGVYTVRIWIGGAAVTRPLVIVR
jgi:hypothetical protein